MVRLCTLIACLSLTSLLALAEAGAAPRIATLPDGSAVEIHDDGTWRVASASSVNSSAVGSAKTALSLKSSIEFLRGKGKVWYDSAKWSTPKSGSPGRFKTEHLEGDVYGLVIAERTELPFENWPTVAVENARGVAPDIAVTKQEVRTINGRRVLFLQMDGTIKGMKFTYLGHYASGAFGSVQVLTYTAQNLLPEARADMEEFINGIEISADQ